MSGWRPEGWYFDESRDSWCLTKAGEYDIAVMQPIKVSINTSETRALIEALERDAWIKPSSDGSLRESDLKIIHRLIDVIEKRGM